VETDITVNKEFCLGLVEDILVRVDKALYQSKRKDQEHITIADNLHVNRNFSPIRTSTPVATVDLSVGDAADELVDNVMA